MDIDVNVFVPPADAKRVIHALAPLGVEGGGARSLAKMLYAQGPDFDARYSLDWLGRILTSDDTRRTRFEALIRSPA